ncbi:tetratricopeptide repeat protein [Nonlabens agnitus]|uniref:Uncharacterized protein n=1 Tax=Nonlabens agnitus TaxID=870484 RepID=A0A2S9WSP1_9FLAO|nr:tetratricopeptide repeat protein [Nonlabens agnitus]PRP66500.1 hypothetical protein BST86_05020 [Nonlabens agnitus]
MTIKQFIAECQKKDVLKLISIYLVSTWVLLQVLAVVWEPIGLPKKSVTVLILILVLGFPFYLYYIYKFKIHIEYNEDQSKKELASIASFKKIYFGTVAIFSVVCMAVVVVITKANFFNNDEPLVKTVVRVESEPIVDVDDRIVVLKFKNNSMQDSLDVAGSMAADWIIQGINEKQIAQVISTETIKQYAEDFEGYTSGSIKILDRFIQPSKIITGTYFLNKDQLIVQSSITDGKTSDILVSFKPQSCSSRDPLVCIENIKQLIMGYLFLENKNDSLSLQRNPPKYMAYEKLLEAKSKSHREKDYLNLLNESISIDPTFFEPQVLRVAYHYGQGNYKIADSLRRTIKLTAYDNKRQANLLKYYEALINGENDRVYQTLLEEYRFVPQQLVDNSTVMVVAQQYVNRPEDVEPIYERISNDSLDLYNCHTCLNRQYVSALAHIELGDYQKVISELEKVIKDREQELLLEPLVVAYLKTGQKRKIDLLLERQELSLRPEEIVRLQYFLGMQAMLMDDLAFAKAKFLKVIELSQGFEDASTLQSMLWLGQNVKALSLAQRLAAAKPADIRIKSLLATAFYKAGNKSQAMETLAQIKRLKTDYDYGSTDYELARYHAGIGNDDKALRLLQTSIADGNIYTTRRFQNDPVFKNIIKTPEFDKIMNYWH